jgi:calcineurin-like phosphoesterase family protein
VWFISDLHWGHKGVMKYCKEFSSEEERRLTIKENIQKVVKKRDLLWILGDSVFTEDCLQDLKDINCQKHLVIGNHCAQHFDRWKLYECFNQVYGLVKKYKCWLSHAPIHPEELFGSICVHGHSHRNQIKDPRYINMCLEYHNYAPRDLNWLREEVENRKVHIKDQGLDLGESKVRHEPNL